MLILHFKCLSVANTKMSLIPIIKISTYFNFYFTKIRRSRNKKFCVSHVPKLFYEHSHSSATRTANRTHARKRAVSGLVLQITIHALVPYSMIQLVH
jgi:hypothetical protein